MSDEAENVPAVVAEEKPKKPRKPRKPRAPKEDVDDEGADEKRSANRVEHEGAVVTLTGKDVKLQVMTPAQQKEHKVLTIAGVVGKPCAAPVVITFKTKRAAADFFTMCLNADEDEPNEFILVGDKTNWYSPDLMDMMR